MSNDHPTPGNESEEPNRDGAGLTKRQQRAVALLPAGIQNQIRENGLFAEAELQLGSYAVHQLLQEVEIGGDQTVALLLALGRAFDHSLSYTEFADLVDPQSQPEPTTNHAEQLTLNLQAIVEGEGPERGRARSVDASWQGESLDYADLTKKQYQDPFKLPTEQEASQYMASLFDKQAQAVRDWNKAIAEMAAVPTREQALALNGATVKTDLPAPTPPSGPVVAADAPDPMAEYAESFERPDVDGPIDAAIVAYTLLNKPERRDFFQRVAADIPVVVVAEAMKNEDPRVAFIGQLDEGTRAVLHAELSDRLGINRKEHELGVQLVRALKSAGLTVVPDPSED